MGLGERLKGSENVGVVSSRLGSAELSDGKGNARNQDLIGIYKVLRECDVEEWRVPGKCAFMFAFVAVRSDEVRAIRDAINSDFALGAAADGADFFTFGGAIANGFAFFADGTGHESSMSLVTEEQNTMRLQKRQNAHSAKARTK